ncbi:MAG: cysteine desulfurase family protein [Acidimicrobiales bacterium]
MIYLDHASTTPLRPEVREAMEPFETTNFGNPSGAHRVARTARRAVDEARETLAAVLVCEPGEVVFTSGGTEADNLAVTGAAVHAIGAGAEAPLVCCSAVEHPAVREPVKWLGGVEVPVDGDGVVDIDLLHAVLEVESGRIVLVSVMCVNNETGVIEPIEAAAALVHEVAPDALFHTDAVQALPWLDISIATARADLVSVTAHKVGGPKGTGALVVRQAARSRLAPILRGGPQERELRPGTHDVAGIVGFAKAADLATAERESTEAATRKLSERLLGGIVETVPGSHPAVQDAERVAGIVNLYLEGASSEEMLLLLDDAGICASAGSACASGALEPSPVLLAMGKDPAEASCHLRFSLGRETTEAEIEETVAAVGDCVSRLRR